MPRMIGFLVEKLEYAEKHSIGFKEVRSLVMLALARAEWWCGYILCKNVKQPLIEIFFYILLALLSSIYAGASLKRVRGELTPFAE